MSTKVKTIFAVREMKIMEDTLEKLNIGFSKEKNNLILKGSYFTPVKIFEDKIEFDSDQKKLVDKIKIEYGRSLGHSILDEKGLLYEEVETEQEIILNF